MSIQSIQSTGQNSELYQIRKRTEAQEAEQAVQAQQAVQEVQQSDEYDKANPVGEEPEGIYSVSRNEDGSVSKWTAFDYQTGKPYPYDVAVSVAPTSATIDWKGYGESYDVRYCNASNYELLFFDDFENGFSSKGWTRIANKEYPAGVTDGWALSSENHTSTTYSFSGRYSPVSYSWTSSPYTSYDADNWLISPLVDLKGTLSFWVRVGNDGEHSWLATYRCPNGIAGEQGVNLHLGEYIGDTIVLIVKE